MPSDKQKHWPVLPDTSEEEELQEIKGNSLGVNRYGKPFDVKQGKPRPLNSWSNKEDTTDVIGNEGTEEDASSNGPLYSDQEQVHFFLFFVNLLILL